MYARLAIWTVSFLRGCDPKKMDESFVLHMLMVDDVILLYVYNFELSRSLCGQ